MTFDPETGCYFYDDVDENNNVTARILDENDRKSWLIHGTGLSQKGYFESGGTVFQQDEYDQLYYVAEATRDPELRKTIIRGEISKEELDTMGKGDDGKTNRSLAMTKHHLEAATRNRLAGNMRREYMLRTVICMVEGEIAENDNMNITPIRIARS
jgi:hypothetical protein